MRKKKKQTKPTVVSVSSIVQTTKDGQITLLKLALDDNDLTVSEEQAVDLCFQLSGMLPNSLKTQLAAQLITVVGTTFK